MALFGIGTASPANVDAVVGFDDLFRSSLVDVISNAMVPCLHPGIAALYDPYLVSSHALFVWNQQGQFGRCLVRFKSRMRRGRFGQEPCYARS